MLRGLIAIAGLGVLLAAAPADAAPSWLAPVPLSPDAVGASPADAPTSSMAVAPDGTAVVAFTRQDGSSRPLQVSRRTPGAAFAPVATNATGSVVSAAIGIDADGDATMVWHEAGGAIRAARLPAGAGAFEAAQTLSFNGSRPALAVGAGGTAVAVFRETADAKVYAALRASDGPGTTFSAAGPVSTAGSDFAAVLGPGIADVAVSPDGHAAVAWSRYDGMRFHVEVAERIPGDAFGAATDVSEDAGTSGTQPAVAIDADGRTVVAWTHDAVVAADDALTVRAARTPLSGDSVLASEDGEAAQSPDLATAGGAVVATWVAGTNPTSRVVAASCGGAVFDCTGQTPLSAAGNGQTLPVVSANGEGAAIVVWQDFVSAAVRGAYRPAGGSFGPQLDVVTNASDAQLRFFAPGAGIDGEGNATAVWQRVRLPLPNGVYSVHAAGFDAAPPVLTAVAVPATATAGASAVPMTATAADRWGPVALAWSFGDGTAASGGAVQHAFGVSGPFDVTVTATDAVGNASSAVRRIDVAAAFTPPPPPPVARVQADVSLRWRVRGKRIKLERMRLTQLPAGATAELRCRGRRCPIRRTAIFTPKRGAIDIVRPLDVDQRRFRAGQRLELRIAAPGHIGQVLRFNLRRGQRPKAVLRCMPVGSTVVRRSC